MGATLAMSAIALLLLLKLTVVAVKIGTSKVNIGSNNTTPTTTTTTSTTKLPVADTTETTTTSMSDVATEDISTAIITDFEKESTTPTTTTTTTMKTTTTTVATTKKPKSIIAIFPPRLKTTKTPKIAPTTATAIATTATTKPVTTTIATTFDATNDVLNARATVVNTHAGFYYCSCDLTLDACDVSCCCDRDCIPEALYIFNCKANALRKEMKNPLDDPGQYEHGLPSCKVNDGWLCVFRTNRQREQQKAPKIDWNLNHYNKWSAPVWRGYSDGNLEHYEYGEALQFLNTKTMTLSQLDLPHALKPPHCQIKQAVKFLKSFKIVCLLDTLQELQTNANNLQTFLNEHQLLLKPLWHASDLEHAASLTCNLTVKICQQQLCEVLPTNNSTALNLRLKTSYVTQIKLTVLHNYTQLLGGMVELLLTANIPTNNTEEIWQHFQVDYIYKNLTVNEVGKQLKAIAFKPKSVKKLISGPLGYTQGEPIIIARFIANNASEALSPANQVLDYFHGNNTKSYENHTLTLFTTQQAHCSHKPEAKEFINYGISTLKQCKLRYDEENLTKQLPAQQKTRNHSEICINLQTQINKQLFGANSNLFDSIPTQIYVSQLGRPANLSATKWTPLHIRRSMDFAPISGDFNAEAKSFTCRNMLLNIAYEFLVGDFTVNGIEHQSLVKQALLHFGERHDLEFDMDEVIEVPLMVTVMFFDYAKDVLNAGNRDGSAAYAVCLVLVALYW